MAVGDRDTQAVTTTADIRNGLTASGLTTEQITVLKAWEWCPDCRFNKRYHDHRIDEQVFTDLERSVLAPTAEDPKSRRDKADDELVDEAEARRSAALVALPPPLVSLVTR